MRVAFTAHSDLAPEVFLCCCAGSQLRADGKRPRVVSGCLRLTAAWRNRRPHTPLKEHRRLILRAAVAREEPYMDAHGEKSVRSVSGLVFFVSFFVVVTSQVRPVSTAAAPRNRGMRFG